MEKNKLSNENNKQLLLPAKINYYEWSGTPFFENSEFGKRLSAERSSSDTLFGIFNLIYIIISLAIIFLVFKYFGIFKGILSIVGAIVLYFIILFTVYSPHGDNKYVDISNNYKNEVLTAIRDQFLPSCGWFTVNNNSEIFFYGNNGCAYFFYKTGELIIYNIDSIIQINRQRIHSGSKTSGGYTIPNVEVTKTWTGDIKVTNNNTYIVPSVTNYYEWHLEIISKFKEYPRILVIMPDSKENENLIGGAYAYLVT
jgi:hypothetical protein